MNNPSEVNDLKKQRGLVVIYDPHALMQFLQFYCMDDHKEIEWDVLCLPKEDGKQEMDGYCEKTGIFKRIFTSDVEFQRLSIVNKLKLFIPMLFYALFGKQKSIIRKIYNTMVDDVDAYDYYAANTESGFMTGMLASFAKEKTTLYFEDGAADYMIERKKNQSIFKKGSFLDFQCVLMAKLGYFGKGYTYFEPTRECVKYASVPNELSYKNYKIIVKFDLSEAENDVYKSILKKVYPELSDYDNISKECKIVFTVPLFTDNKYCHDAERRFEEYISEHASQIYLKKHPRDQQIYRFSEHVQVHEVPQDIPAEMLFPYFKDCECYMMEPDSLLINMGQFNIFADVLCFKDYVNEELVLRDSWLNIEQYEKMCNRFIKDHYNVVYL